jgi:transcriptional regulator with XRE-family HTH domain
MPSPQLSNYLRSNRKRLVLSQGEVAFLLGRETSAEISRYENFERLPSLETALAYEVICGRPLSEIFGGVYQRAEQEVGKRAEILASRTDSKRDAAKREMLNRLAAINH